MQPSALTVIVKPEVVPDGALDRIDPIACINHQPDGVKPVFDYIRVVSEGCCCSSTGAAVQQAERLSCKVERGGIHLGGDDLPVQGGLPGSQPLRLL